MFDRTAQIPSIQTLDDLSLPTAFDDLGVAQISPERNPFSEINREELSKIVDELEATGRFTSNWGKKESQYKLALIRIDPDAEWVSPLDERFREICANRAIVKWFEERHGSSSLYIDTLQVNLMESGDYSRLHTHDKNRQELNSVLLLEPATRGGHFCVAPSMRDSLDSAHPYELSRGGMVIFRPSSPHGVLPVLEGRRISIVWGLSSRHSS